MRMIDTNILKTKLASRRLSWGREIEKIRFSTYDEILKIVLKQHALIKNILICFYILNISKINNIKLISTRSIHHAAQKCRKSRADSKNSQKNWAVTSINLEQKDVFEISDSLASNSAHSKCSPTRF